MGFSVVTATLASDVATSGTFTVSYPSGQSAALYTGGVAHKLYAMGAEYSAPGGFTVSFGASNITVTWLGATTLPANSTVRIQFDRLGTNRGAGTLNSRIVPAPLVFLDLGAPLAVSTTGLATSQAVAAAGTFVLNGARVVGGVAYMDVPRNVTAGWTGTSILTIRGYDVDGVAVTETTASGVSHTGTKCFAAVNSITSSAAITAATAGFGLQIGCPVRIPAASHVLYQVKNNVVGTVEGTLTVGVTSAATGTTGDTRGRYLTLVAPDGATSYGLLAMMLAPDDRGVAQYAA
jgi:hypothetical protein